MPKTKTSAEYEAEIRKLYPEVQLLKNHCECNPDDKETLKELEKKKETLRWFRDKWAERTKIIVYVANNEQLPNSEDELRCDVLPMPQYHAKKWPHKQVGDYQAYIPILDTWYPVVRERKTINDLHGTLVDKDHRQNLFEEYERFVLDERFTIFRFDLECFEEEFYNYFPPTLKNCRYCTGKLVRNDFGDYHCTKSYKLFPPDNPDSEFKCDQFTAKKRDPINEARIRSLKKKIIDQCFEMGMQIKWRGSRKAAYEAYRSNIETWMKLNYVRLLGLDLDPLRDIQKLRRDLAYHKSEVLAKESSIRSLERQLGMIEVV
jgi:hypothetical protein